jgi:capsular polysaccharide biosynthesis protein
MIYAKNGLRYCKQKIKQLMIKCDRYAPINPIYIGSAKGYYSSAKEYWQFCKDSGSNDVDYTAFLPSSINENKPPHTIYNTVHSSFNLWISGRYVHENPETFVISIPNGKVFGNMGTIITHDDKLLFDVSLQFGVGRDINKIKSHLAFNYLNIAQWQQIPDTVAALATPGAEGYYHWLTDALPRLEILRKVFKSEIAAIDKYIVNTGISIIAESLELLDIPREKLIFIDPTKHFQVKNLVVPSLPGFTGTPPPWIYTFLRESFLKHKANIPPISRLYVSRSKARYRKVTNEEDVLACLVGIGFIPVWLEEHDFATQIALFANAEFIVAPHGAGLTNLVWCQPGAKVLEIFSPNYVNICYWTMANHVGVEYHYLIGDGEKPNDYYDPHLVEDSINIPMEEFVQSLDLLLSSELGDLSK